MALPLGVTNRISLFNSSASKKDASPSIFNLITFLESSIVSE